MTATEAHGASSVRAYSDVEYVFEAHKAELPDLRVYLRDLLERRGFVTEKAKADIRGKRNSTVAGQLWAVLDPLFQAIIYFFLITVLRGGGSDYGYSLLKMGGLDMATAEPYRLIVDSFSKVLDQAEALIA